jgi:hypothetical protein
MSGRVYPEVATMYTAPLILLHACNVSAHQNDSVDDAALEIRLACDKMIEAAVTD